jgi:predicted Ser/Thr protein kinase
MPEPILCPQCGSPIPGDAPAGLCPKCMVLAGLESQPAHPQIVPTQSSPAAASSGFVPPSVDELATRFPQLEILELLGRGGMGAVYKARQRELDRLVAVKILPPEVSRDPAFAERFTREARALARLNHPKIVAVYDFGRTRDEGKEAGSEGRGPELFYFIMEYVDGVNLRQAIQSGSMNPEQALAIVPQICDALQFAHDEGVVHRDIKPENILIDKRGRVKIADFGLAKLLGQDAAEHGLTGTQQVMGTLRYMAPEQMEGAKTVDHRADIFSLGVVFYELLTGELPTGRFAPPSKKVEIDVRLDEVVLRALEHEPEQRYQHASEVKTDMETIAKDRRPIAGRDSVAGESLAAESPLHAGWLRQPHMVRLTLQTLLIFFFVLGMIACLTVNRGADSSGKQTYFRIGVWHPWYRSEWQDGKGGGFELNFISISFLLGVAALSSLVCSLKLASWDRRRASALKSPMTGKGDPARIRARAVVSTNGPRPAGLIGLISLWTSLAGLVLPIVLAMLGSLLANALHPSDGYFLLCGALGVVLELAALGCGLAGIRSTPGKAGLSISLLALVLSGFSYLFFALDFNAAKTRWNTSVVVDTPASSRRQKEATGTPLPANIHGLHSGKPVAATPEELAHIIAELPKDFTKGLLGSNEKSIQELDTYVCAIDFDDGPADFWLEVKETGQETFPVRMPSRDPKEVWRIPRSKAHLLMWIQPRDSVAMSSRVRGMLGDKAPGCVLGIDVDGKAVARVNYDVPVGGIGQPIPQPLWFGWASKEMRETDAGFDAEMAVEAIHYIGRKASGQGVNVTCQAGLMYRPDRIVERKSAPSAEPNRTFKPGD